MTLNDFERAAARYCSLHGISAWQPRAALIDMDGVLFDSMPAHARAWQRMMSEEGVPCTVDEFFLYEGMTGKATIELLMHERLGHTLPEAEIKSLYARKTAYFREQGQRRVMPGADRMLRALNEAGMNRVLVTGSGQSSLLDVIEHHYPGAFPDGMRVTALDVERGKPDPEPYLMGLEKAACLPTEAMVIENAPLGVQAGHAAGCFTVAVATGPIPHTALSEAGADLVFDSMPEFADLLPSILNRCQNG